MTKQSLRTLLMDCAEKLNLYRTQHSGEYVGGVEYMELQRRIVKAMDELPADEPGGEQPLLTCRLVPGVTKGDELIVDAKELLRYVSQYRVVPENRGVGND